MKRRIESTFLLLAAVMTFMYFFAASVHAEEEKKTEAPVVSQGKTVRVNYTLTVDGKVEDSSKERGPLEFRVGGRQVIPGFEKAVMGMKAGEKKSFKVAPEDAYGQVDPGAVQLVPRNQLPSEMELKEGMVLTATSKDGESIPVRVVEIKGEEVLMDFNHPLAGKTLDFDAEVVEIK